MQPEKEISLMFTLRVGNISNKNTQITFCVRSQRIDTLIKDDYVSSLHSYYRLVLGSFVFL